MIGVEDVLAVAAAAVEEEQVAAFGVTILGDPGAAHAAADVAAGAEGEERVAVDHQVEAEVLVGDVEDALMGIAVVEGEIGEGGVELDLAEVAGAVDLLDDLDARGIGAMDDDARSGGLDGDVSGRVDDAGDFREAEEGARQGTRGGEAGERGRGEEMASAEGHQRSIYLRGAEGGITGVILES